MTAPTALSVRQEIARELEQVQEDTYGETECHVDVSLHETFVAVIMDLRLSLAEEALVDSGNAASVKVSRDAFQLALASTFSAIVERATGRRVVGFASHAVVDEGPAWAMDVFRLGKSPAGV
jgi:uncharacterized protein YbcI